MANEVQVYSEAYMEKLRPVLLSIEFRLFLEDCYLCLNQMQFFGK